MAETQAAGALASVEMEGSDLASLLQKEFKPKSEDAKSAVEQAVQTLAAQALAQTQLIGSDVVASIEAMIASIDLTTSLPMSVVCESACSASVRTACSTAPFASSDLGLNSFCSRMVSSLPSRVPASAAP